MEQGTAEWLMARLGKVTASRITDLMARTKTGYSTSRANYMAELLVERLSGEPTPCFINAAMAWGTEKEPEARAAYAFHHDADVTEIAFVEHPSIPMAGASPDGLVGADGLVEIKCPMTATHLDTLESGKPAGKYVNQMMWQMACTGRQWCDFVSYDPRLPEHLRLFVCRVERDAERVAEMEAEVSAFLSELDARITNLNSRYGAQMKEAA